MVLHHISLPPLSEVRQRLRRSIVPPKLPTHQHILLVLFAVCLILFARALGGYGQVKGHALIHCPLLSDGHKYLPIALMHEGKIAELNLKLREEELMARMARKNDVERRAEAVDGELHEEAVVTKGESPADEVLLEEQMPENDLELPISDEAPTPLAPTEATDIFADDSMDEAIYEPDLKGSTHDDDEGESASDVGDAGPFLGEDDREVMAEEQILD